MELNYRAITERLSGVDRRAELVNYIFSRQGSELHRLDYDEAAIALKVDRKTISRYIDQLADKHIILLNGNSLQINMEFIKEG